jgi:hypothetical protein
VGSPIIYPMDSQYVQPLRRVSDENAYVSPDVGGSFNVRRLDQAYYERAYVPRGYQAHYGYEANTAVLLI